MNKLDLGLPSEKIITRIKNVWNRCDLETRLLLDDLFTYWETANLDLATFNLRLQKQWTEGSNLYTQKEVDALVEADYTIGFDVGYDSGYRDAELDERASHDFGFRPQD